MILRSWFSIFHSNNETITLDIKTSKYYFHTLHTLSLTKSSLTNLETIIPFETRNLPNQFWPPHIFPIIGRRCTNAKKYKLFAVFETRMRLGYPNRSAIDYYRIIIINHDDWRSEEGQKDGRIRFSSIKVLSLQTTTSCGNEVTRPVNENFGSARYYAAPSIIENCPGLNH